MEFKEVLITEDNSTYSVKKEVTAKVVIKTRNGFIDNNRNLCVVEDTGNGYIAHFPSFTSTQQDHYVCLDYAQAEYLMQAIAEFLGKEVLGKDEVPIKAEQEELVSEVAQESAKLWCETCQGTGMVYQEHQIGCHVGGNLNCPDCNSNGYITSRVYSTVSTPPETKPDHEVWIRHEGGKQPQFADDIKVDVKCRDGTVHTDYYANSWDWSDDNDPGDIVAWRYTKIKE